MGDRLRSDQEKTILGLIPILMCLVLGVLVFRGLFYAIPAVPAIVSVSISIILIIRQKQLNLYSIGTLAAGLMFLACSVIWFGYAAVTHNMPIHDRMAFDYSVYPKDLSYGIAFLATGILILLSARYRTEHPPSKLQSHRFLTSTLFIFGGINIVFGLVILITWVRDIY